MVTDGGTPTTNTSILENEEHISSCEITSLTVSDPHALTKEGFRLQPDYLVFPKEDNELRLVPAYLVFDLSIEHSSSYTTSDGSMVKDFFDHLSSETPGYLIRVLATLEATTPVESIENNQELTCDKRDSSLTVLICFDDANVQAETQDDPTQSLQQLKQQHMTYHLQWHRQLDFDMAADAMAGWQQRSSAGAATAMAVGQQRSSAGAATATAVSNGSRQRRSSYELGDWRLEFDEL
ncbi:hypothetical protein Ccrd_020148, partial [Cynara cardunculus var. scolymus]